MLKNLKKFSKHSVTVAWGYTQMAGGAVAGGLASAGAVANDLTSNEAVKNALQSFNNIPKWIIPTLIVFGYVTVSARIRSLNPVQVMNNDKVKR